jgi:hypothetical protein
MNWQIAHLLVILANLALAPNLADREPPRRKEPAPMQTKPDKMGELFKRYETLRERYTKPDGTSDADGEIKEENEIVEAIIQLCAEDVRNIERLLDRIDVLLTSMPQDGPEEYIDHYHYAGFYICILSKLKVEAIKPYHQRIKDLMLKAFEAQKHAPEKRPSSLWYPPYQLLNIDAFLDFQHKKSPDVFKQYGKLAIEALLEGEINPLADCQDHQPEEAQRYLCAAMDYVFDCMVERPEEAWWPLAWIVRNYALSIKTFPKLDYLEQKLAHPSPVGRFVAALVILLKKDPQHQKARQVLLEILEHNVKSGTAHEYVTFLELNRYYKGPENSSFDDLFAGGRNFAPFWAGMPLADARRMLALLKKFVQDNYQADLRKPFVMGKTVTTTGHGVWLIGGLVMHHRELIPDCQDLVPILLEMLEEGYKLKNPPFVSPLYYASAFALQAMGGDAAKKAVEIILTRLLKDENRFDIHLIGELGEFGPAAKDAVPILRKLYHEATDVYVKAVILESLTQITSSDSEVPPQIRREK